MKSTTALAYLATVLMAPQQTPAAPSYNIMAIGLGGSEHTGSDGRTYSEINGRITESGKIIGYTSRYEGGVSSLGWSAWVFDGTTTVRLGLTGTDYIRSDGVKASYVDQVNESGYVRGHSARYNGGDNLVANTAWLYNGTTTLELGLTGPEYTHTDGYTSPHTHVMNQAGQIIGRSVRYNGGSTELGFRGWLFNGTTTVELGLTGVEHTSSGGYMLSVADGLNEAGQVTGQSARYNPSGGNWGQSAWLYNGTTTLNIGLTGAEHTRNDGYRESDTSRLNQAGQVAGISSRFNGGGVSLGDSAWLFNGTTTFNVGLTGVEHTRGDDYKNIEVTGFTEAGYVYGRSERFNGGSSSLGYSVWSYNGSATLDIGLTGARHTRGDGYKHSLTSSGMNQAGQIIGTSRLFDGSNDVGLSCWLYDGTATVELGLSGPEYTRSDGFTYTYADHLNNAGHVGGTTARFDDNSYEGETTWLYDGTTTVQIGLTGPEYTRSDGLRSSYILRLNEVGQVLGSAQRYDGGSSPLAESAWLYDPTLGQTFSLALSTRSDGFYNTSATYLGDDGVVLGTYTLFDTFDNDLGSRAFYFTIADGMHDLGDMIAGGLSANGWDRLDESDSLESNGAGQIIGYGKLIPQTSWRPYLLTPIPTPVPETASGTIALLTVASMLASALRRRNPQCGVRTQ